MKKLLLASSALVVTAGMASADVTVGGTADVWAQGGSGTGQDTFLMDRAYLTAAMSGSGDYVEFGANVAIKFTSGGITKDNSEVYISMSGLSLTAGDVDAADQVAAGSSDFGVDGLGFDNVVENGRGAAGAEYRIAYNFGDFTIMYSNGANLSDNGGAYAVGFTGKVSDISFGLGMNKDTGGNQNTLAAIAGTFGQVSGKVYYENSDVWGNSYDVIVGFNTGAATISVGYASSERYDNDATAIGVAYDLGGGATLKANYVSNAVNGFTSGTANDTSAFDLGVSMSF